MKRVAILLATYNGEHWLGEQLDSLLTQAGVEVTIFASDDSSTDGTVALLQAYGDERIRLLPRGDRFGSAAGNFFRLLRDVDFSGYDAVSLADQDDIWYLDKLQRALALMEAYQVSAVSGNVMAFWPDGRRLLICKSQPQKRWDHVFEAAGPGCTYVLSRPLAQSLQSLLREKQEQISRVALHDWLIYCYARSHGFLWHIDARPQLDYRQHANNVIGANMGRAAAWQRFGKVLSGWYREQILLIAGLCGISGAAPACWLKRLGMADLYRLLLGLRHVRRSHKDMIFFGFFLLVMFFSRRAGNADRVK